MNYKFDKISVLGDGSWGTALANLFADNGFSVMIWCHDKCAYSSIKEKKENSVYLKGIKVSEKIQATLSLEEVFSFSNLVLFVIPSKFLRNVLKQTKGLINNDHFLISGIKGIENETLMLPGQIIKEFLPFTYTREQAFLSGPTFALEVAWRQPTTCVISSKDHGFSKSIQRIISNDYFRCYTNDDTIGVQIGGAIKNVIALASGVLDGLGLGSNSQAALITRGLAEITRLGAKLGAQHDTFYGVSGLGDLVLTATGKLSRNRQVGYKLGKGMGIEEIVSSTQTVAESVSTTRSVYSLAKKLNIEMPICQEAYNILYNNKPVKEAISSLMLRSLKDEAYSY